MSINYRSHMYLKRVLGLAQFLAEGEKSSEELARFLVLKAFVDLAPKALYLAEISDDACVTPVAAFGFDKTMIAQWGRFPLSMHLPMTESIRRDECVIVRSVKESRSQYPLTREIENFNLDWTAVMAFPMLPYGVGFMTLNEQPPETEELSYFAKAVGAMLALQLSRSTAMSSSRPKDGKKSIGHSIEFTERQRVIHQLISQGFTNAQIAAEVGFSESLIRQESIRIFRVLGVSGRKEIIESKGKEGSKEGKG